MTSTVRKFAKQVPGMRSVVAKLRLLRRDLIPRAWVFNGIYARNEWGDPTSRSGEGSNLTQTQRIRQELPNLWRRYGVRRMLDAPCGDFQWMRDIAHALDEYVGMDIVGRLIETNSQKYGNDRIRFRRADIVMDPLPASDLILCRDALVHLCFRDMWRALQNFRRSGASYLLVTTFIDRTQNEDIENGQWRPLNLQRAPFNFPPPLEILNEGCTQRGQEFADKSLALWRFADLPSGPATRKP
jgi:hypothetical protein